MKFSSEKSALMALQDENDKNTAKLVNFLQFYDLEDENKSLYDDLLDFRI